MVFPGRRFRYTLAHILPRGKDHVNAPAPLPAVAGVPLSFYHGKAAELARDIVMQIDGARALAHAYGLTDDQWDILRNSPAFKQLVADTQTSLQGAEGTMERIRRKAGLALEHAIPEIFGLITNEKSSPAARVAAFDSLKDAAGVKQNSSVAPPPATFQLNISFPTAPERNLVVDVAQPAVIEHEQ
jgi:hypothetical protein